jgi:glycerate kinase
MILIANDKFKGTMTAACAAQIIAAELGSERCIIAPMADGGEGTAQVIANCSPWRCCGSWFYNPLTREAAVDSSAAIGLQQVNLATHNILTATSAPLAHLLNRVAAAGAFRIYLGIGGTATCDGGEGMLDALSPQYNWQSLLIGLSDVAVPLADALMFAPQKGATPQQLPLLADRLRRVQRRFGGVSPWDGAGGGVGYAVASVIGAHCMSGAEFVLSRYNIDWNDVDVVITGEGRIDAQTSRGKVVSVVQKAAALHGVPCIAIGGCVDPVLRSDNVIDTSAYLSDRPLTASVAEARLRLAVRTVICGRLRG